jgi:formamidopyrimidine-DNA glycosylase
MPELPDLEVIREVLGETIVGSTVRRVEVLNPLVLRCSIEQLTADLTGRVVSGVRRRGKFLLLDVPENGHLVFHPMLSGRFQLCPARKKRPAALCLRLALEGDGDLRYLDRRRMGRIYWVRGSDYSAIPQFAQLGPEADDPAVDEEIFRKRIRRHRGMIKNVLTNQRFLAGIGNAYADEILFEAGILPFRPRFSLTAEETARLHQAIGSVLRWAGDELRRRVGGEIDREVRDFLKVHRRGGQACVNCGGRISEVAPNRRITSFCRTCQR